MKIWQLSPKSTMASPRNLYQVESPDRFKELLSEDLSRVSLLYFWAPWAEPCKQMTEVVKELAGKYPSLLSLQIEAEEQSEISESFEIESVPSFLLLRVRRLPTAIRLPSCGWVPPSLPQADPCPPPPGRRATPFSSASRVQMLLPSLPLSRSM